MHPFDPPPPDRPATPWAEATAEPSGQIRSGPDAIRRATLTLLLAGALLAVGGVAMVNAATPEPSPAATPSSGSGTGAPDDDTSDPAAPADRADCRDGTRSGRGNGGSPTNPAPSAPAPVAPTPGTPDPSTAPSGSPQV